MAAWAIDTELFSSPPPFLSSIQHTLRHFKSWRAKNLFGVTLVSGRAHIVLCSVCLLVVFLSLKYRTFFIPDWQGVENNEAVDGMRLYKRALWYERCFYNGKDPKLCKIHFSCLFSNNWMWHKNCQKTKNKNHIWLLLLNPPSPFLL